MMENDPGNSCAIGNLYAGETRFALSRRALVVFDVAGQIPPGATINSAEVRMPLLRVGSAAAPTDVYRLHRLQADWGESSGIGASECFGGSGAPAGTGDATGSHRFWPSVSWGAAGGDFAAIPSAAAAVPITGSAVWPSQPGLVADVQSWLDAPTTNFGWIVIGEENLATTAREFGSRDADQPPELLVDYSSVPAETTGLQLTRDGQTAILVWDSAADATGYDVLRGPLGSLPVGVNPGGESCLGNDLPVPTVSDPDPLAAGAGVWYVVRGENGSGPGTYGFRTDHLTPTIERTSATCP